MYRPDQFAHDVLVTTADAVARDLPSDQLQANVQALVTKFLEPGATAVLKFDDDQQMVWGWASVAVDKGQPVHDLQGDVIEIADLQKAAHEFVVNERVSKEQHAGPQIGTVVDSIVFTKEVQNALGINLGREGWYVGVHVEDPRVWARVKKGELAAFSIGGSGEREPLAKEWSDAARAAALEARKQHKLSPEANATHDHLLANGGEHTHFHGAGPLNIPGGQKGLSELKRKGLVVTRTMSGHGDRMSAHYLANSPKLAELDRIREQYGYKKQAPCKSCGGTDYKDERGGIGECCAPKVMKFSDVIKTWSDAARRAAIAARAARRTAQAASDAANANMGDDPKLHDRASELHSRAAKLFRSAGDSEGRKYHDAEATRHDARAAELANAKDAASTARVVAHQNSKLGGLAAKPKSNEIRGTEMEEHATVNVPGRADHGVTGKLIRPDRPEGLHTIVDAKGKQYTVKPHQFTNVHMRPIKKALSFGEVLKDRARDEHGRYTSDGRGSDTRPVDPKKPEAHLKSPGHLGYVHDASGVEHEAVRGKDGDVYWAPTSNTMDTGSGYRGGLRPAPYGISSKFGGRQFPSNGNAFPTPRELGSAARNQTLVAMRDGTKEAHMAAFQAHTKAVEAYRSLPSLGPKGTQRLSEHESQAAHHKRQISVTKALTFSEVLKGAACDDDMSDADKAAQLARESAAPIPHAPGSEKQRADAIVAHGKAHTHLTTEQSVSLLSKRTKIPLSSDETEAHMKAHLAAGGKRDQKVVEEEEAATLKAKEKEQQSLGMAVEKTEPLIKVDVSGIADILKAVVAAQPVTPAPNHIINVTVAPPAPGVAKQISFNRDKDGRPTGATVSEPPTE